MSYGKCEKCGKYHWSEKDCANQFIIFEEDYLSEEGKKITAWSFIDAAEEYGKYRNDEGQLLEDPITIEIQDSKGSRKKFTVSAEIDVRYNCDELNT